MSEENCGNCAYAQKTERGLWCPFHDFSVTNRNVCDDFLDEYQSPHMLSLTADMTGNTVDPKLTTQYTANDIFVYVMTVLMIGLSVALMFVSL